GRVRALPLGAVLDCDAAVVRGDVVASDTRAERFPRDGAAIARSAVELFEGTPYEWGGVTPWGADCSGMVQAVFGLHGIPLPRDARQQAEHGDSGPDILAQMVALPTWVSRSARCEWCTSPWGEAAIASSCSRTRVTPMSPRCANGCD